MNETSLTDVTVSASKLRPELRQAFEASWKRNEEAYRYLGRYQMQSDKPAARFHDNAQPGRSRAVCDSAGNYDVQSL